MKAKIVVGLQFGDEGKGLTTDYLSSLDSDLDKIVVRFSGGQQAGHNVKIGNITHVHSNYGSGTLRGFPSYFSDHCTFYPNSIYKERKTLLSKNVDPILYLNPLCKLTTPGDFAFNRVREKRLGHGSCGMGIGTTMSRNINTGYKLYAIDLLCLPILKQKVENIREYYFSQIKDIYEAEYFINTYNTQAELFFKAIDETKFNIKDYSFLRNYDEIIFEGSQGILLDMDHGIFPNVTFSNTTSRNALEICNKIGISHSDIEIFYISRCYQTRHGNGWMSNNDPIKLINNEDEINVFNEWQTNFRIGEIDYSLIDYALSIDTIYSKGIKRNLVITCIDQRPDFKLGNDLLKVLDNQLFWSVWTSNSPSSETFLKVK